MGLIDIFAKQHGTTRYKISKISGISENTLADANKRSVSALKVKIVKALAVGVDTKNVGKILNELIKIEKEKLK